jgi:hypothetical protein
MTQSVHGTAQADGHQRPATTRAERASSAGRARRPSRTGVSLEQRDHAAFQTLFFVDWMDAAGLHALHYQTAGRQTVLNRLNRIFTASDYLVRVELPVTTGGAAGGLTRARRNFYALSRKARGIVSRSLERRGLDRETLFASKRDLGRENPELDGLDVPETERADHLKKISDLYAEVMPRLFAAIGPPGPRTWFWRNERRAYRPYSLGSQFYAYRPDAEVVVALPQAANAAPDANASYAHLLIEVQTEASHKGPGALQDKVASYVRAFPTPRASDDPATRILSGLYWAAETEAHKDAAFDAADRLGVANHMAGSLGEAADALAADACDPLSLA